MDLREWLITKGEKPTWDAANPTQRGKLVKVILDGVIKGEYPADFAANNGLESLKEERKKLADPAKQKQLKRLGQDDGGDKPAKRSRQSKIKSANKVDEDEDMSDGESIVSGDLASQAKVNQEVLNRRAQAWKDVADMYKMLEEVFARLGRPTRTNPR